MGKFFKALEQAELDRALRERAGQRTASLTIAQVAPPPPQGAPPPLPVPEPSEPLVGRSAFERLTRKELLAKPQPAREMVAGSRATVEEHLVSLLAPTSFGAEQYRALRHTVEQLRKSDNLSVVGVSSPETGDGKTITAINLAGALAQGAEARVLIIDADLRRSSVVECLGSDGSRRRGLVGAILDQGLSLTDVIEPYPPFNLSVVPAGGRPSAQYELLKSSRMGQLLEEARQHYDYVVLDMPPLVPFSDCKVIGQWVDGFLIVVAAHKTARKLVEEALKVLDPVRIIGLVFNGDDQPPTRYSDGRGRSSGAYRARFWRGLRHGRRPTLEGTQ